MDDFVHNKLTEWGLSEYIQKFEDEGIDEERFYCLDFQDIAHLIPKVGPSAIFKKRLMLLKEEENTSSNDSPPCFQQENEEAAESDQVLLSTSVTKDKVAVMDDVVCDILNECGLSNLITTFEAEGIHKGNICHLRDETIRELIPKAGPRDYFKAKLDSLRVLPSTSGTNDEEPRPLFRTNFKMLKGEEKTIKQGTIDSPVQLTQEREESAESDQVLPPTSATKGKGKRKLDLQGESSKWPSTPSKRKRDSGLRSHTEKILSDVKNIMNNVKQRLLNHDNNKLIEFLTTEISSLEEDKREQVGVFGRTGAGKSSLINAVIEKKILLSGSICACTSVMIKVEANMKNKKYEADIEFITKEEWYYEMPPRPWNDVDEDIDEKMSAIYGKEWKTLSDENLKDPKNFKEIPEFLQSEKKNLTCASAEELSVKCAKYTRTDSTVREKERKRWYWPLVKCVTVRVPNNALLQHVTLVDLPGTGDCNESRDKMWKEVVGSCSTVWIVTEINRAASEKEPWEILESASSLMGNGGECQQIHFICTKSDQIKDSDNKSAADFRACVKEKVIEKFCKLEKVKKHFRDDCFKVFTVSSEEFLAKKQLQPDETEIPKLQEFLQNLNDCHSETFNYVSGAYGILSLIQGARHTEVAGKKNEVCTELNENKRRECYEVQKSMNDTEIAFRKYLSKGVENSKKTCQEKLESNLNPKGVSGRGFHRILKCVVRNHGTYKPKNKKQINLNETLASCLTDSIDEEFRKTFPNERKCKPFNGVINKFSLDTKSLIERFTDVKLQLIFLKTEEIKMKTKLNKEIRDRKKKIYNSLTERIEKSMKECYEKAAGFKGEDTLKNMKETIMKHVLSSKDIMFEQAKEEMLSRLRDLMDYILKTLEETMQKSIELSLKTDDYPLPDFEAELEEVQKYYNDLKKRQEEETPQICFALLGEAADA
ncbi:nuclear GTPase SLIP-GC-like isoform X2 [Sparus aurata]|uniref:nuclear GTPase SLIP-GC-like isoform X2 n=1 Tax=Sparus aurata TaxID=8175 RepID=UPI0011C1AA8E|nr:nuclear GTPase SLIP-GC-like isoform X2 [Sparus aurata]